jgi:hypothetical protein
MTNKDIQYFLKDKFIFLKILNKVRKPFLNLQRDFFKYDFSTIFKRKCLFKI